MRASRGSALALGLMGLVTGELQAGAALWLPQPRHLRVYEVDLADPASPRLLADRCSIEGRVRPYALAPGGDACVLLEGGYLVVDRGAKQPRRVFEVPDLASDRFAVGVHGETVAVERWGSAGLQVAVLDVSVPVRRPRALRLRTPGPGRTVVDFAWEAGGGALLVLEYGHGTSWVVRVPLEGEPTEVFRKRCHASRVAPAPHGGRFLVPTSQRWTELGGARDAGTRVRALDGFGVSQLTWGPRGDRVAFLALRGGRTGLFLADLDAAEARRLGERIDTHTFAFSPSGAHVYWASSPLSGRLTGGSSLHLAETAAPCRSVTVHQNDDPRAQVGGASMNAGGSHLAYTVGSELYLYELATGRRSLVARFRVPWALEVKPPEVAAEEPSLPSGLFPLGRDPLTSPPQQPLRHAAEDRPEPLVVASPAWRAHAEDRVPRATGALVSGRIVVALVIDCDHPRLR